MSIYIALGVSALGIVLAGALVWRWWHRRKGGAHEALRSISVSMLRDVLVPDGMGGQIYVDHLLLTGRGIAVVDVKDFGGAVFASDRMQEWTVIDTGRRFGFPNPQGALLDRVAAVRQLVSNVPIEGHIVFASNADFSKGRPKHVMLAAELERHFGKPNSADRERLTDAYAPHWAKIKAVTMRVDENNQR
ncbi:MAG: nuclease-related domain-containing protein [Gammaproteobacteria bacterium]|jgi:hypothetical protein